MVHTRSSNSQNTSPLSTQANGAQANKRKAGSNNTDSNQKGARKEQKTIEQTHPDNEVRESAQKVDQPKEGDKGEPKKPTQSSGNDAKDEVTPPRKSAEEAKNSPSGAIENASLARVQALPSAILERGVVYFFARGRVGISDPASVKDIARTYMVLRPLPENTKIGSGPLEDVGNSRLLALPKKVLPKSHHDAFMMFVEKAGTTVAELKDDFMKGSKYSTQTQGMRFAPPVTPVGEGVYAMTSTGRSSHFAYMLTIPESLGEVQKNMGLADKGSFIMSTKNPQQEGPANASLPQSAEYPKEILESFRNLRWIPTRPQHIDYGNAQFLIIGEGQGELRKAAHKTEDDEEKDKESPEEELEMLKDEDQWRTDEMEGDASAALFKDLGLQKQNWPSLKTSW